MRTSRFQVCDWRHEFEHEPKRLWSEIDIDGWEVRKIEIFPDESVGLAAVVDDRRFEVGSTALGTAPVPLVDDINQDRQFAARQASAPEFESEWLMALSDPAVRDELSASPTMSRWVEMRALVGLSLGPTRKKPLWGDKNRSVVFSFPLDDDLPLNLMAEFTTPRGAALLPGEPVEGVAARVFGPLWMVSVVVERASFSMLMGGVVGSGSVRKVTAHPPYGLPEQNA